MTLVPPDEWRPQGVEDLEPNAWQALREEDSVCVTAGAGAGKTEFLAQKAAFLLQTGACPAPNRILAISFKRDAARNLSERVAQRCPSDQARRFDSLTFDAFTKGLLDRFRSAVSDPFRPAADYEIAFVSPAELSDFLSTNGFHDLNANQFERTLARTPLPVGTEAHPAYRAFWEHQYGQHRTTRLTFSMINRLVEYLLRENPRIRRALHTTYPFVFLDEFQDTTHAQFEVMRSAFDGSDAVFTAVGDDKQRIMGWAGAMPDAFKQFSAAYAAKPVALLSNWRSHADLVKVQHVLAERIEPGTEKVVACADRDVSGDVAAIWEYRTQAEEADGLAAWFEAEIAKGIPPYDLAVLVRSKADDAETAYSGPMAARGVRLRNIARSVGGIAIQDLLCEDLTRVLLPLLRLGAAPKAPSAWAEAQRNCHFIFSIAPEDETARQRATQLLHHTVRSLRAIMAQTACTLEEGVKRVATDARDCLSEQAIRRAFPGYHREQDFSRAWEGFLALLVECGQQSTSWSQTLDCFEGTDEVSLMTVHKSKGLEFHTIVFCGLDNQTWWSLKPNGDEELKSFFVAFTRARQRAFFTLAADRGKPIDWIEQLLAPAGLNRVAGPV